MKKQVPASETQPHPLLQRYYSALEHRAPFVRDLFNKTAPHYDRINTLFSLGSGRWYRREALKHAGLRKGMRQLDVAIGTGLVAREGVILAGDRASVVGLDVSENMLAEARRSLGIGLIQGRAEALPVADQSVDLVSMGYALRHVSDISLAFSEFHRVLKPGGIALILEISQSTGRVGKALTKVYLGWIVPFFARWTTSAAETQTLMQYYWDTIENCVEPAVIMDRLRASGFVDVRCDVSLGVFRAYRARRTIEPQGDAE